MQVWPPTCLLTKPDHYGGDADWKSLEMNCEMYSLIVVVEAFLKHINADHIAALLRNMIPTS